MIPAMISDDLDRYEGFYSSDFDGEMILCTLVGCTT